MAELLAPATRRRTRLPLLWRVPAAWRLLRSPHAKGWEKALLLVAALYVVLPLDAIPDLAPFIGWLDDLGVIALTSLVLNRALHRHGDPASPAPRQATAPPTVPALPPRR